MRRSNSGPAEHTTNRGYRPEAVIGNPRELLPSKLLRESQYMLRTPRVTTLNCRVRAVMHKRDCIAGRSARPRIGTSDRWLRVDISPLTSRGRSGGWRTTRMVTRVGPEGAAGAKEEPVASVGARRTVCPVTCDRCVRAAPWRESARYRRQLPSGSQRRPANVSARRWARPRSESKFLHKCLKVLRFA